MAGKWSQIDQQNEFKKEMGPRLSLFCALATCGRKKSAVSTSEMNITLKFESIISFMKRERFQHNIFGYEKAAAAAAQKEKHWIL